MAQGLAAAQVPEEVPHGCKHISTGPNWKGKRRPVFEVKSKETKVDYYLSKPRQLVSEVLWVWPMFAPPWNWEIVGLGKCRSWSSRSC